MRVLDLFCGAGGAAAGYAAMGWEVVGVDIKPQPHYPYEFHRGDAVEAIDIIGRAFDLIHASPPCQSYSITGNLARAQGKQASSVDLVAATRQALRATLRPYIIENVPGSPLLDPVVLCGSTFGLGVRRHRLFESNLLLQPHGECRHKEQGRPIGVYHTMNDSIPQGGKTAETLEQGQQAMGIGWMTWKELTEAVPPAYTLFLARQIEAMS
jgi:DNA (cytosine-5)-methyltransferase 1